MTALPTPADQADLELSGLSVRYGGLHALRDLSLVARAATVTGLIGPNGAGKTTAFNACTGLVEPFAGHVALGGEPLIGKSPSRRAQLGLGRTFQRMELWPTMTVRDNVGTAWEALRAGHRAWGQLWAPRRDRLQMQTVADAAMTRCEIGDLADRLVADLSTGQRRLVEFCRALASGFRFLLLDEPSSGLDVHETGRFGTILEDVVSREGIGVLLVEHDMTLVRRVCSYIYALEFGSLIFEGTAEDVLASDAVRAAYLGAEGID